MSESTMNRRRRCAWLLLCLMLVALNAVPGLAQDANRVLVAGTSLSGALGPDASAVTYVFDAAANSTANLSLG